MINDNLLRRFAFVDSVSQNACIVGAAPLYFILPVPDSKEIYMVYDQETKLVHMEDRWYTSIGLQQAAALESLLSMPGEYLLAHQIVQGIDEVSVKSLLGRLGESIDPYRGPKLLRSKYSWGHILGSDTQKPPIKHNLCDYFPWSGVVIKNKLRADLSRIQMAAFRAIAQSPGPLHTDLLMDSVYETNEGSLWALSSLLTRIRKDIHPLGLTIKTYRYKGYSIELMI